MIRTLTLILALLSLSACVDGYTYPQQQQQAGTQPPQVTVINETNYSSSWSITINDGQRAGEHRGQTMFACANLSDLRDHLDGWRGPANCREMILTTAEDMGYYRGHHIVRFMNHGLFYYGANAYQPPRANPSDYCYDNYGHNRRMLKQCLEMDPFN